MKILHIFAYKQPNSAMADRDLVRRNPLDGTVPRPLGQTYLLAVAIDEYQYCTKLSNAVLDVETFIEVLTTRYTIEAAHVTFIKNLEATKRRIEQAFLSLIKTITPRDNLIIYFSGHGRYDKLFGGNWVPVEAGTSDESWPDYLSNGLIKDYLSRINSFHTFLIADSCFSGSLFIDKSRGKFMDDRRDDEPSRWGLTSGKEEIVSDGEPGHHSPFAAALLDVLCKAEKPPGVMQICDLVMEKVVANAGQTPMGSPLQIPGHQGGQMVLYFKVDEEAIWKELGSTVEGCRSYLKQFPDGKYQVLAEETIVKDRELKSWEQAKASGLKSALLDFELDFPKSTPVISGELQRLLEELEEEELWARAQQSNTITAYRSYLLRTTSKLHAAEAEQAIKAITQKEKEPAQWQKAQQLNTIAGYEAYLLDYPEGSYAQEAKRALVRIRDKEKKEQPRILPIDSFYLSKYEVTVAEFKQFIDATGYQTDADKDGGSYAWDGKEWTKTAGVNWECDPEGKARPSAEYSHPVIHVSWNDATAYARWLYKKTGLRYRLPTEAEWEYAAGNGSKHTKFSWGNGDPSGKQGGNVSDETAKRKFSDWTIFEGYNDGFLYTAPVGSFNANEFGLHDMSGNVWEWCWDWYGTYPNTATTNPLGPTSGVYRVFRGGSWMYYPINARVANRNHFTPDNGNNFMGFRLARNQ